MIAHGSRPCAQARRRLLCHRRTPDVNSLPARRRPLATRSTCGHDCGLRGRDAGWRSARHSCATSMALHVLCGSSLWTRDRVYAMCPWLRRHVSGPSAARRPHVCSITAHRYEERGEALQPYGSRHTAIHARHYPHDGRHRVTNLEPDGTLTSPIKTRATLVATRCPLPRPRSSQPLMQRGSASP
jgi:hypothetical protein